jgi:hypothetical protein
MGILLLRRQAQQTALQREPTKVITASPQNSTEKAVDILVGPWEAVNSVNCFIHFKMYLA